MRYLLALSSTYFILAVVLLCGGCVTVLHGERVEKIKVAPDGTGSAEISFELAKNYIEVVIKEAAEKPGKTEYDPKDLGEIINMSDSIFAEALDREFIHAYESGFLVDRLEFDREKLSFKCSGYFLNRSFLNNYWPGGYAFEGLVVPTFPYLFLEEDSCLSKGFRARVTAVATDKDTETPFEELGIPDLREFEDMPDNVGEGWLAPRKFGNIRMVRIYEGILKTGEIVGFEKRGDTAVLEFDYRRMLEDLEYNKEYHDRLESGFWKIEFDHSSLEACEAEVAEFTARLHEAKLRCASKYLELLKKYPLTNKEGDEVVDGTSKIADTEELIRMLVSAARDFEVDWHAFPSSINPTMLRGSQTLSFWLCNNFEEFFTNPHKPFRKANIRARFIPSRGPYIDKQEIEKYGKVVDEGTLSYKPYSYTYFKIYDSWGTELIFRCPGLDWSVVNPDWKNNSNSFDIYSAGPDGMHSETRPDADDNLDNIGNFNLSR